MLLLNHKLSAHEAHQFNLVSEVFKKSELDTVLWPKIESYSKLPIESVKASKKLIAKFEQNDLKAACESELEILYKRFETDEFMEAVANFMQRKSKL